MMSQRNDDLNSEGKARRSPKKTLKQSMRSFQKFTSARPSSAAIGARRSAGRNRPYNEAVFAKNLMASSAGLAQITSAIQNRPVSAGTVNVNNLKKLQQRAKAIQNVGGDSKIVLPKTEAPISISIDGEIEELATSDPACTSRVALTEYERRLHQQACQQRRMNKLKQVSLAMSKDPSDFLLDQMKLEAMT